MGQTTALANGGMRLFDDIRVEGVPMYNLTEERLQFHLRLRMIPKSDQWGAWGYAVGVGSSEQSATRAQGAHAEHMLLIVEETPGLSPALMMNCTASARLQASSTYAYRAWTIQTWCVTTRRSYPAPYHLNRSRRGRGSTVRAAVSISREYAVSLRQKPKTL